MNPQAFPASIQNQMNGAPLEEMKGMDLRDYFAAKILPSIYADSQGGEGWRSDIAKEAYRLADAMLEARKA